MSTLSHAANRGAKAPTAPSHGAQETLVKPAIEVRGINKSFGDKKVLDAVDLQVAEGSIYGLLGPNGAGKTTLIRILTTLLKPSSGEAYVFGANVVNDAKKVRASIGLAGQFAAVDGHLTGRENLVMVGQLYNLPRAEARKRADDVLERIHLTEAADQQAHTYSGGMKRRLDLAACMVGRPRMLFLDEPTTGIDPRSRLDVWELIQEMVDEGTTVMLTTQYLDEAERLADLIGVIDEGKLVAEGTADSLKDTMGADLVELSVASTYLADVTKVLVAINPNVVVDELMGKLTMPAPNGPHDLMAVIRQLETMEITPLNIGLRRPSLDDVFLNLTDHNNSEGPEKTTERESR